MSCISCCFFYNFGQLFFNTKRCLPNQSFSLSAKCDQKANALFYVLSALLPPYLRLSLFHFQIVLSGLNIVIILAAGFRPAFSRYEVLIYINSFEHNDSCLVTRDYPPTKSRLFHHNVQLLKQFYCDKQSWGFL